MLFAISWLLETQEHPWFAISLEGLTGFRIAVILVSGLLLLRDTDYNQQRKKSYKAESRTS